MAMYAAEAGRMRELAAETGPLLEIATTESATGL